jgi:hypothetical protein
MCCSVHHKADNTQKAINTECMVPQRFKYFHTVYTVAWHMSLKSRHILVGFTTRIHLLERTSLYEPDLFS